MGFLSRCMMSEEIMSNATDLDWDSPDFQRLRQSMLDGKWDSPGCDNCRMKEETGAKSQRQNWLTAQKRHFVDGAYDNPQITGNTVRHLFLNFNNVCNFKCRMCSPRYSNSLIPEHRHLKNTTMPNLRFDESQYKNINNVMNFLEFNRDRLKDVVSIWITGGEPFIDNTMFQVNEILKEYAKPEQISMSITTNGSRISVDQLDVFNCYKQIHFDLSMDTPGPMFEYMRSAGIYTWPEFDKFVDELAEYRRDNMKWLLVSLNSSYQVFNATRIKELYEYTYDKLGENHVNHRLVIGPKHFQARQTPDSVKQTANQKIDELLQATWLDDHDTRMIEDARKMLNRPVELDQWKIFVKQCIGQDKFRGTDLREYDPILGEEVYTWQSN